MPTNDARLPRRATRKPAAGQMTVASPYQRSSWGTALYSAWKLYKFAMCSLGHHAGTFRT